MKDEGERQIAEFATAFTTLSETVGKVIVGHKRALREVILTLFAGGHVLLEGVPGIGKTLLVRTLSRALRLTFRRIQFTPDLMPADVLGTHILEETPDGRRGFRFEPGPVFGHLILADEVNRATPKTQSALLEAMEERSVTVSGETHPLTEPFMVLATQNPIEMEGTYPLPEAQLDRFLFKVRLAIEGVDQIVEVIDRTTGSGETEIVPVGGAEDVLRLRRIARGVVLADHLKEFVARLVMATHPDHPEAPERVKRFVKWGASPRGAQAMILSAKVLALTRGRPHVAEEDLRDVAFPALRHRLILSFEGEAEGVGGDDVLEQVLERIRP
jgi:MoxR-like ATPase